MSVSARRRAARRRLSRPLIYQPRGGDAFRVAGTLSRPSAEELVGGLDEQQRVFIAPWAEFAAAGVTAPDKFDGVADPGPEAYADTVAAESPQEVWGVSVKLAELDATGSGLPISSGDQWAAYNPASAEWQSGLVLNIDPVGAPGGVELLGSLTGLLNQPIIFYPATVQEYSVHNVAVLYQGARPAWVRAEVTG